MRIFNVEIYNKDAEWFCESTKKKKYALNLNNNKQT